MDDVGCQWLGQKQVRTYGTRQVFAHLPRGTEHHGNACAWRQAKRRAQGGAVHFGKNNVYKKDIGSQRQCSGVAFGRRMAHLHIPRAIPKLVGKDGGREHVVFDDQDAPR